MIDCDACMKHVQEEHFCPYCQQKLTCCNTPPFHVGDGLGWGTDVFFLCLNDECPLFTNSWQQFENMYGQSASCRYMLLPGEKTGAPMMVGGRDAFKGSEVDPSAIQGQNVRYLKEKEAVAQLDTCVEEKNLEPVLALLLDERAALENRTRACELLEKINDIGCVDPLRNHSFRNPELEHHVNHAIHAVLKNHFKRECPHCMEIIKAQAHLCKHCGKEVS